jgi:hypothetical protein
MTDRHRDVGSIELLEIMLLRSEGTERINWEDRN